MTGKGPNGLKVHENLKNLRTKRVFDGKAELELTKCEAMPTKRQWPTAEEAVREAEVRSEVAKLPIYAYHCQSCGYYHLSRKQGTDVVTRDTLAPSTERKWEVFPVVPGNKDARLKLLAAWLESKLAPTTTEIIAEFDWHPTTVSTYMTELGWVVTKGRYAKWSRKDALLIVDEAPEPVEKPVEKPERAVITPLAVAKAQAFADSERTELEKSIARHPASQLHPWADFDKIDTLRHIPLGDIIDMLRATGAELRIQHRKARP